MNDRLYGLCDSIADTDRKQDIGLFFKSIHRTLDHILYGDMAWLLRFQEKENEVPDLDQQLHDDFNELKK